MPPINFSKRISIFGAIMSTLRYKLVFFKNVKSPLHHKMAIWNGQL